MDRLYLPLFYITLWDITYVILVLLDRDAFVIRRVRVDNGETMHSADDVDFATLT